MRLIVGLGNPGKGYEYTRHNLGFLAVRALAERFQAPLKVSSFTKGIFAEFMWQDQDVVLLMPMTYMNNSGVAVKQLVQSKEISFEDVLVICDDFNLDFEQIRVRTKGSDGGHNGLSSVIYHLESEDFARLRMGIGTPSAGRDVADFVLEEFLKKEKDELNAFIKNAVDCSLLWLEGDIQKAMETYNRKKENGKD